MDTISQEYVYHSYPPNRTRVVTLTTIVGFRTAHPLTGGSWDAVLLHVVKGRETPLDDTHQVTQHAVAVLTRVVRRNESTVGVEVSLVEAAGGAGRHGGGRQDYGVIHRSEGRRCRRQKTLVSLVIS